MGKETAEAKAAKWLLGAEGKLVLKNAKQTGQYRFPKTAQDHLYKTNVDNLASLRAARIRETRIKEAFFIICIILVVVDLSFFLGTLTAAYLAGQLVVTLFTTAPGFSTLIAGALGVLGIANVIGFAMPLLNRALNGIIRGLLFIPKRILGYSDSDSQLKVALTVAEIRGSNYKQGKQDEITLKSSWLESSRNQVIGSAVIHACKVLEKAQQARKTLSNEGSSKHRFVPGFERKANTNRERVFAAFSAIADKEEKKTSNRAPSPSSRTKRS